MASTVTSEEMTPLMGFLEGEDLKSKKLMRRRLTVMFERREMSTAKESIERKRLTDHGRSGDTRCS